MLERYRALQRRPDGPASRLLTKPIEAALLPLVVRLPVHPNAWTLASFVVKAAAAWWIGTGRPWGAVPLLLAAALILDGFDGDVARWRGTGSFLGSCLDNATDLVGTSLLLAAYAGRMLGPAPSSAAAVALAWSAVAAEVLHQTVRIWISVTGEILKGHVRLAAWDRAARARGWYCLYSIDSCYLLIGVGPLLAPMEAALGAAVALDVATTAYLVRVHLEACRAAPEGERARAGLRRRAGLRLLGLVGGGAAGIGLRAAFGLPAAVPFLAASIEFLAFATAVMPLVKRPALAPADPAAREAFVADMVRRDLAFLDRAWP